MRMSQIEVAPSLHCSMLNSYRNKLSSTYLEHRIEIKKKTFSNPLNIQIQGNLVEENSLVLFACLHS